MTRAVFIHPAQSTTRRFCPVCRTTLDAFTEVSTDGVAATPKPGNLTMCWKCRSVLVFTATGFRAATDAEIDNAGAEVKAILKTLRQ